MPSAPIHPEQLLGGQLAPADAALSPDGKTFVFAMAAGRDRHLFTMPASPAAGGMPVQITGGIHGFGRPCWSPDGKRLAAEHRGGVWTLAPDCTALRCVSRHAAGDSSPCFFPDGNRLLFCSRRNGWPQWFAVPVGGDARSAVCLTPGDRDWVEGMKWGTSIRARLSPDGKRLVCHSRCRDDLQRCEAWAFPTDGSGKGVCLTPPGEYWDENPVWGPDGKHVYVVSEGPDDGWLRLTRVDPEHPFEKREALTQGPREDLPILFGAGGTRSVYRRIVDAAHELYAADGEGKNARRVSIERAYLEPLALSPDGKALFAVRQTPMEPPHLACIDLESGAFEALTQRTMPGRRLEEMVAPERIAYTNREGVRIEGWLFTPKDVSEGRAKKAPLLLSAHGGPRGFCRYDWNAQVPFFLSHGYGILQPDFRGSTAHGRAFRKGNHGRWGDADVIDLVDGARWAVESVPWTERDRIAIYGGSYGGYMVYCCVTRAPEVFRCGAAGSGDSEIYESYLAGDRPGRIDLLQMMGDPDAGPEIRAAYREASPLYRVEDIRVPLQISHNRQDRSVVPLMSELIINRLRNESKFVDAKIYDNPDHGGIGHGAMTRENSLDALRRRLAFLDRHLKGDGQLKDGE